MSRPRQKTASTIVTRVRKGTTAKDACLVLIYGGELGRKYHINAATLTIGRSSKSDIQIDHPSVSRDHARLSVSADALSLRDLGSTNGTYINDERLEECTLKDRDIIKIGHTIFKFLGGGNVESAYHDEIYRLTTMDGLTQAYNKRYLLETLERELSRAHRHGREVSLIMLDIDHFKKVNDTHGHLAGDSALKQLATLVKEKIRREDLFARFGGEEFAVVLPETDHDHAMVFAEKIRGLVEQHPFEFESTPLDIKISLGVTTTMAHEQSVDEFIKQADDKLYDAKRGGRNRVCG